MGFSGGGSFSTGPKMNVTPLIDVLLVLIIVFMVVVIEQRPTGLQQSFRSLMRKIPRSRRRSGQS